MTSEYQTVKSVLIRRELETTILRLAEENQLLDWEIPSQYDRMCRNGELISFLEARIETFEELREAFSDPIESSARSAVKQVFSQMPPVSGTKSRRSKRALKAVPITRGHLTLIHSTG